MEIQIGGTVYFENEKGQIDSFICKEITEDENGFILQGRGKKCIYFEQALEETDPRVVKYIEEKKNKKKQ